MHMVEEKWILSRPELEALLGHASEDEGRPHVCCVGFFPIRRCAAATDGQHRLAILASDGPADVPQVGPDFIVPRAALAIALGAMLKDRHADVHVWPERIDVVSGGKPVATVLVAPPPPGSNFPPHEQVLKAVSEDVGRQTPVAMAFDARYIAKLALVSAASGVDMVTVHWPASILDPILVITGQWRVFVMPGRMENVLALQTQRDTALAKRRAR